MKKIVISFISIIIIIVIIVAVVALKDKKTSNEINTIEPQNEINEVFENEIKDVGKQKISVEEYLESIHPVKEGDTFPIFNSIEEADIYWIWSTSLENGGKTEMGTTYAKKKDILDSAKKLYGSNIPDFPESEETLESLDIHYLQNNNSYSYVGNSRSIPKNSFYKILSKNEIEKDIFEVEIAEYLVYEWAEPYVLIEDIYGETLARFDFNDDYSNSEELEQEMQNYINENINNFNKKILTIKYDRYTGNYNILSSRDV